MVLNKCKKEFGEPAQNDTAYSLAESRKGLGELTPVLEDAHGNIIDGFHRRGETPSWHGIAVPQIDNPVKLEMARLAVNFARRKVSPEEITQRVTFLINAGVSPDEIAKKTGISKTTIYKYMPEEAKNKAFSELERKSAVARAEAKEEENVSEDTRFVPPAERTGNRKEQDKEHDRLQGALDIAAYPNCPVCLEEPNQIVEDLPHVKCGNGHEWNLKTGDLLGETKMTFPEDEEEEESESVEEEEILEENASETLEEDKEEEEPTREEAKTAPAPKPTKPVDYDSANKSCPICGGPVSPEKYERLKKKFGAKYPALFKKEFEIILSKPESEV
jgi:hypothetical protein